MHGKVSGTEGVPRVLRRTKYRFVYASNQFVPDLITNETCLQTSSWSKFEKTLLVKRVGGGTRCYFSRASIQQDFRGSGTENSTLLF